VRFQVLKADMKMKIFWDIASCSLIEIGVSEVHNMSSIAVMTEAVRTSETSVYFNKTSRRYIPEDCHLQIDIPFTTRE
jgi:hypothetical protein